MGGPLRFNTGDASVDARLQRLETLAGQPTHQIEDGVSLEDWIDDVLREMRALPHDILRRLKPEALYCWDSPRRWDTLRIVAWYAKASAGLRQRLAQIADPSVGEADVPAALSASMGVTHSYRHYLNEGLAAIYPPEPAEVPEAMLEQIARIAAGEGAAQP